MAHDIYNLTFDLPEFECCGYRFTRRQDYQTTVDRLYRGSYERRDLNSGKVIRYDEFYGEMLPTYTAKWIKEGSEPECAITKGRAPLIFDVLQLWTAFGGQYSCTGKLAPYEKPRYYGESLVDNKHQLIKDIDSVITQFKQNPEQFDSLSMHPCIYLLVDNFKLNIPDYQCLLISPILDRLSGKEILDNRNESESKRISEIKMSIEAAINAYRPLDYETSEFWQNTIKPFHSDISRLGSPRAADKLSSFLKKSPAISNNHIPENIIESHAKAFNQFRNASVHYTGLPDMVKIEFTCKDPIKLSQKTNRDQVYRGLIYYTQIFRYILHLHFFKKLNFTESLASASCKKSIADFFNQGLFNGHDWISDFYLNIVHTE